MSNSLTIMDRVEVCDRDLWSIVTIIGEAMSI